MQGLARRIGLAAMVLGLVVGVAGRTEAGIAFTLDNATGQGLGNPPFTLGFNFTTNQAITVTHLGLFDDSLDGLVDRHEIGLWDSGGNLLASGFIGAGTVAPLTNQFRYISIAPVNLTSGQQYSIGALYETGADALIFPGDATNFATDPAITFDSSAFAFGGALSFPGGSVGADPAYFGPNFRFTPTAVIPEPTTLAGGLLAVALLGGHWLRHRRRIA